MLRRVIQHVATLATVALLVGAGPLMHRRLHFRGGPADDAVVHYACDEGSGTTLVDSGSKGLNATHDFAYGTGHVGDYSIVGDGNKSGASASSDVTCGWNELSVCFWLYVNTLGNYHALGKTASYDNRNQRTFEFSSWAGYWSFQVKGESSDEGDAIITESKIGAGQWVFVVATWGKSLNSGNPQIYLNNAEASYYQQHDMVQNLRPDSTSLKIGKNYDGQYKLNGSLDDIRIYNYAIGADKRAELYAMGPPTYTVIDCGNSQFNGTYVRSAAPGYWNGEAYAATLGGSVYYWTQVGTPARMMIRNQAGNAWHMFDSSISADEQGSSATTPPTGVWAGAETVVTEN